MLRRPLTVASAAFAAGIAYQHLASGLLGGAVMSVSALMLLFLFFYLFFNWYKIEKMYEISSNEGHMKKLLARGFAVILCFFLVGSLWGRMSENRKSAFDDAYGETIAIAGRIGNVKLKSDERCRFIIRVAAWNRGEGGIDSAAEWIHEGIISEERVIVTVDGIDAETAVALTGRTAIVYGRIELPQGASNPGSFDYGLYLRSKKVLSCMFAEADCVRASAEVRGFTGKILNSIAMFRFIYEQKMISLLDDECGEMLAGILFGDDSMLDDELKDSFQKNGLAHLLAASGLHTGFVYGLFYFLFGKPRTVKGNIPVIAMLIVYAALAEFSSSVIRAVFMITVMIAGRVRHRRYDFLTCISFCAMVMLVYEPMNLFSSGFQLSFMAVLTLSTVLKRIEKLLPGIYKILGDKKAARLKPVLAAIAGMVAIQLGMMPLTLKDFHYLSIASLFLNVPAIALAGLIVPLGIILIPLIFAGGPLLYFFCAMEELILKLLLGMNRMIYDTPFSFKYMASPPAAVLMFYYICLFFVCSEAGCECRKKLREYRILRSELKRNGNELCFIQKILPHIPLLAGIIVSVSAGFALQGEYLLSDIIFVDVGQGDCAHIRAGRGVDIMLDSGGSTEKDVGKDTLLPYFLGNGVSEIDLAVISHLHTDHYAGLLSLKDCVKIRYLLLSAAYASKAAEISEQTGVPQDRIIFASAGDVIDAGGGVTLRVLAPETADYEGYRKLLENSDDENLLSLIVQAEYKGRTMLFTGDIDSSYEEKLIKKYSSDTKNLLDSDILKVAHHGSRYSSSSQFIETVSPSLAVIQVGRNFYGHPAPDTLKRLKDAHCRIYRNDESGAVMIRLSDRMNTFTAK